MRQQLVLKFEAEAVLVQAVQVEYGKVILFDQGLQLLQSVSCLQAVWIEAMIHCENAQISGHVVSMQLPCFLADFWAGLGVNVPFVGVLVYIPSTALSPLIWPWSACQAHPFVTS